METPIGVLPCGVAARNTLRLESAMALYGHEISETTTLYEANLGWICKLGKGDCIGREALGTTKEEGRSRKLLDFEMVERGIARDGHEVFVDGRAAARLRPGVPPHISERILDSQTCQLNPQ